MNLELLVLPACLVEEDNLYIREFWLFQILTASKKNYDHVMRGICWSVVEQDVIGCRDDDVDQIKIGFIASIMIKKNL